MKINFVKEFWFKATLFTTAMLVLTVWALTPISSDDLSNNQQVHIEEVASAIEKTVNKNLSNINDEVKYLITQLSDDKINNELDTVDSSVKAIFELEQKESQLQLTGKELRSLDLSYWTKEDINKSINKNFKTDDGLFYQGYQLISSPSGESHFGYLVLNNSSYYFVLFNLHFASIWSKDLDLVNNKVYLINSIGELLYHPQVQYIGTEFNYAERILESYSSENSILHFENKESHYFVRGVMQSDLRLIVSRERWTTPYSASFYGKFLLVLICLGLLLYYLSEYLSKKKEVTFGGNQIDASLLSPQPSMSGHHLDKENKKLSSQVKKLEHKLALQKEFISPEENKKAYQSMKSKCANLIGQVQLLEGQVENEMLDQVELIHSKSKEIYKEVLKLIEVSDDNQQQVEGLISISDPIAEGGGQRTIDYQMSDETSYFEDNRIVIEEEDIGVDDLNIFQEVKPSVSLMSRIEKQKKEMNDDSVESNVLRQLEEQDYKARKSFNIEEDFLKTQREETLKITQNASISEQMNEIDRIIEVADRKVSKSKSDIKKIIRKPRLTT